MTDYDLIDQCLACNSTDISDYISTSTMMAPKSKTWQFQKCSQCSLVFLNPRVKLESLGEYYQDYYLPYRGPYAWGKYASLVAWDLEKIDKARIKSLKKYSDAFSQSVNPVLLDVGCGKPTFLKSAQSKGYYPIGIDFSDKGWKDEKNKYSEVELHIGEPSDIPKTTKADIITMWHYLEHDYDPQATLSALLKNTKPNTRLIIEVPNHDSSTRKKYGADWAGYHTPRHTALYNPSNMTTLLERSGWRVVDSYTYGTLDPYTLDWMSRMEKDEIDWAKNMEKYFKSFVIGKLIRPYYYFDMFQSQGFMTIVACPS